jgi:signal transduction histidine kinase
MDGTDDKRHGYPLIDEPLRPRCIRAEEDEERTQSFSRRLHEKIEDYNAYNFTNLERTALNIFFDLAQEYPSIDDLYAIVTTIPKVLFDLCCNLYLLREDRTFAPARLMCDPLFPPDETIQLEEVQACRHQLLSDHLFLPIKANVELIGELPFQPEHGVIGALEISPAANLSGHQRLFFQKFANRIGFQLHNRSTVLKNKEHIDFIQNLVQDIGHNVIVPNMYFKLFFSRLKSRVQKLNGIQKQTQEAAEQNKDAILLSELSQNLENLHTEFNSLFKEILNHYEQTSMFLETLLRRSHFEQGRYVLEPRECNLLKQIIHPQLERFLPRFREAGIELDMSLGGVPDQQICIVADMGLISQVYANLFSNAEKYAEPVQRPGDGEQRFASFGWEVQDDPFQDGRRGIKLNVFSSGRPLPAEDAAHLYTPGFRGKNAHSRQGSGHGLAFVKQVVELHGGRTGFEATEAGNNFYFILPLDSVC